MGYPWRVTPLHSIAQYCVRSWRCKCAKPAHLMLLGDLGAAVEGRKIHLWQFSIAGGLGACVLFSDQCHMATGCEAERDCTEKDIASVRGVVSMLRDASVGTKHHNDNTKQTPTDPDDFLNAARLAYEAAAGPQGTLTMQQVDQAVKKLDKTKSWFGSGIARNQAIVELGPLLFRILDANRDGKVTLKEFLMGQALLFAAAKAKGPTELGELCWRLLDIDQNGFVDRLELREAVRVMALFGAIRMQDRNRIPLRQSDALRVAALAGMPRAKADRGVRQVYREQRRSIDELVIYYMEMYDTDHDGKISRAEFARCGALRENFWNLITDPEAAGLFLVETKHGRNTAQ